MSPIVFNLMLSLDFRQGIFAITKLGEALSSLIGCEAELARTTSLSQVGYVGATENWRESADEVKIKEWTRYGTERLNEVKADFMITFLAEYTRLMRLVCFLSDRISLSSLHQR